MPYDPRWTERYTSLASDLNRGLGTGWTVEHVGSTSVPGLPAKPVIDLAIGVPDGNHLRHRAEVFHGLGWTGPVTTGDHQAFFLLDHGLRKAIAHTFTAEQWPDAHPRLFADWLRGHPADRDEYARLKNALVRNDTWGKDYTEAKRDFVEEVVNRARAARSLAAIKL